MKNEIYIKNWLKENLSAKRYEHSIGCADTAKKLAQMFNIDSNKAYMAGLMHDCAKNMDDDELLKIIKEKIKTGFDSSELKNPKTYHAIAGTYFAKKEFEVDDIEIISAIRKHTIGSVDMSLFDKIIFLADKIEPNTRDENYSKDLWEIIEQNMGEIGLDLALYKCFQETIKSLVQRKLFICPMTIDVYNKLQENLSKNTNSF